MGLVVFEHSDRLPELESRPRVSEVVLALIAPGYSPSRYRRELSSGSESPASI